MIELIFAIVIIAITALSLPMMTQITSRGGERNIVQEAIFAASTELNQVVSYRWDENSTQDDTMLSRVISTSDADCNATTKLRPGHINQPYHRRCIDDTTIRPSALGSDGGDLDDLDDIDQTQNNLFSGATVATAYKQNYTNQLTVGYADFGNQVAVTRNIKEINSTVRDAAGNIIVLLRTYSANIGEIDYYKRRY